MEKKNAKLTLEFDYVINPDAHPEGSSYQEMVNFDIEQLSENPEILFELLEENGIHITYGKVME